MNSLMRAIQSHITGKMVLKQYIWTNGYPIEILDVIMRIACRLLNWSLVCNGSHVFFMVEDIIFGWGYNDYGQLGLGDKVLRESPTRINIPNIKEIVCGSSHTLFLTHDGEILSCGHDPMQEGYLERLVFPPRKLPLLDVKHVFAGENVSFALCSHNEIYKWGYNDCARDYDAEHRVFQDIPFSENIEEITIATGNYHRLIHIKSVDSTEIYGWGDNSHGQLGLDATIKRSPLVKLDLLNVREVIRGNYRSFLITCAGDVYASGMNYSGALGLGHQEQQNTFIKVIFPQESIKIVKIATGIGHTLFLTTMGNIYVCGANGSGQLGLSDRSFQLTPLELESLDHIIDIAAGDYCSMAITSDGSLYAWGSQFESNRLGIHNIQSTPKLVSFPKF